MKLIIDIPEEKYNKFMYSDDVDEEELVEAFEYLMNGTPIPDKATNGEAVKTLFSNTFDNFCERTTWEWNRWWKAPYQKGGTSDEL